jgi:MFS family permease
MVAGVWGVHVPSLKAEYDLSPSGLAGVLLATSLGSLLTLFVAGRIVGQIGARNTTVVAGLAFAVALGTCLILPGVWALLPLMVLLGAGESVYDVAINAEGTMLETLGGRAVMSGFHGMFSLGAMVGSAGAAGMLRLEVPPVQQLAGTAVFVGVGIMVASRGMLESHPTTPGVQAHFAWPRGTLLIIGLLILCGMLAEGVMYNWSVLYVQQELGSPQSTAALAYVAFAGATALMRFAGDAVRVRMSERAMLYAGPLLAAVSMSVILVVARPWPAIAGMALVGVGLATIVPLLYNAATRVPGVSRAAAIASVSSIGYLGFMIGPPIIGGLAQVTTLTAAMGVLIVATLILAAGAARVPAPAGDTAEPATAHAALSS